MDRAQAAKRVHDNDSRALREAADRLRGSDPWLARLLGKAADQPYQAPDKAKGA